MRMPVGTYKRSLLCFHAAAGMPQDDRKMFEQERTELEIMQHDWLVGQCVYPPPTHEHTEWPSDCVKSNSTL